MAREPILVDCEVGPHVPHQVGIHFAGPSPMTWEGVAICRACGEPVGTDDEGLTVPHLRPDVLAMIERGDYD